MEQLGCHWTDFNEIWEFPENLPRKLSLIQSEKNNGHFTHTAMRIYDNIWVIPRIRNVSDKSFTENQNTHFMFNNAPKIVPFMR